MFSASQPPEPNRWPHIRLGKPGDDPSSFDPHATTSATKIGAHAPRVRRFEKSILVPLRAACEPNARSRNAVIDIALAPRPVETFASSCCRMQSSFNELHANKVQSARELCSENAICEVRRAHDRARLIEGIEPLRNREANCAALAVQRRHSPPRHLFARSVIASPLIVQ